MKKLCIQLLSCALALTGLVGCGGNSSSELEEQTLTLAAAASLQNAFEEELISMFNEKYPNVKIEGTYASSGDLQTQIENGLAADVFFSAATKQMNALEEEELINSDTRIDLLENKVVLIVPSNSSLGLSSFEDITKAATVAIGDPDSVPAGQYAKEALTNLGLWDTIEAKASLGKDVTEVLNQVAAGSADAGIVYATDAASISDKVIVIAEAPADSLETPVIYPVAVTAKTEHEEAAKALVEFLKSDAAIEVFVKYGFASNVE